MSRWSDRGQVDPLPALVAVAALGVGLSLYAGAVSDALGETRQPHADRVLDTVHDRLAPDGVVRVPRLASAVDRRGVQVNATLTTRHRRWTAGPTPPSHAASARRQVSIQRGRARVRPGRLRVSVW